MLVVGLSFGRVIKVTPGLQTMGLEQFGREDLDGCLV